MYKKWPLEITLIILVLLTILAVVFKEKILQINLTITPESHPQTYLYTDALSGGNSTAEKTSSDTFEWKCHLQNQFAYPYCGFEVYLGADRTNGKNLNQFEKIKLWVDYSGNSETLRIYLRNFDPIYSKKGVEKSTKYNQLEFPVALLKNQPIDFSLRDFFVANWWIVELKIDPELSHPQFDNIVFIEVHTGSQTPLGEHSFHWKKIELSGQWISAEKWYLLIMSAWLAGFLLFIVYRVFTLRTQIRLQKKREQELLEINSLLNVRSKEFEEKSKTDSLTGAFNREGIEEAILVGLAEWRNQKKPLSLILIDIDHFKNINDLYGHTTGDSVLSDLSQLIKQHIRTNDLFARWGGEEFVLFCRNTNLEQTLWIAEKIRGIIVNHKFTKDIQITASMGVATLKANEALEQLFNHADIALYQAKHQGRNKVVTA
jgi:diguanylate cyclase (GGDEF)-like protein